MEPWSPVLAGADAERARAIVARAAARLDEPHDFSFGVVPDVRARIWLSTGLPGITLAHAYLALAGGDDAGRQGERAVERLGEILGGLVGLRGRLSLANGLAGVGFTLAHLARIGLVELDDDDPCAAIDDTLAAALDRPEDLHFDLVLGLAGMAVYALERGAPLAARLAEELARRAEPAGGGGMTWRVPPDPRFASAEMVERHPQGWWIAEAAHGSAGVLPVLAATGVAPATARAGLVWLGTQPAKEGHRGWCGGELGLGTAMHLAAEALGDEAAAAQALGRLVAEAARAPRLEQGLGLCHGVLGRAHGLARLHARTGDARFAEAARAAYALALDELERPGVLEAGPPGLFDGVAGIALALLAATVPEVDPGWDRLFLLSLASAPTAP